MTKKGEERKTGTSQSGPDAPENLEANARAYFRNAERFRKKQQQRSMFEAYEKALELGRASGTPDGLAIAAEASLYLGHWAKTRHAWGIAIERYKESVFLGRKAETPESFYTAARASWNLGNTFEEAGMDGLESAFSDAIEFGRAANTSEALEVASKAAFNLAANLEPGEGSVSAEEIDLVAERWRETIELGKACGTDEGTQVATKATQYLDALLKRKETS